MAAARNDLALLSQNSNVESEVIVNKMTSSHWQARISVDQGALIVAEMGEICQREFLLNL